MNNKINKTLNSSRISRKVNFTQNSFYVNDLIINEDKDFLDINKKPKYDKLDENQLKLLEEYRQICKYEQNKY